MKSAAIVGLGASFFVFGILWLVFSSSLDYVLLPPTGRNVAQLNQLDLARQLAGIVVATMGAGLWVYGHATRANLPSQTS